MRINYDYFVHFIRKIHLVNSATEFLSFSSSAAEHYKNMQDYEDSQLFCDIIIMRLLFTDFELESELPTDTFRFGGQTGNIVTQLVFRKK